MKNAKRIYNALLTLYPRHYRKAFGAQMMQTFLDHYTDIEQSEGRVGLAFWLSTVTDEIHNLTEQHRISLREENTFREVTAAKLVVSAALLVPLYAVFCAAFINVSLALPHPHVSGIGVLIVLTALLLLPGILSVAISYLAASAFVSVFAKRKVGSV